jgi:hypothetical protein
MVECPKCHHRFPESVAKKDAFELFHVLRDQYAEAQGMNKVEAKDILCVQFGVSIECEKGFKPPSWPGVFCRLWGRLFFRKSTLAYTKDEMSKLIEATQEVIHVREEV